MSEPTSSKQRRLVSFALIALGSTAVIVPILLLRRSRAGQLFQTLAPPRSIATNAPTTRLSVEQLPKAPREDQALNPVPFRGSFYAFKALGIATCIVGASALAAVGIVRWRLGIHTTDEFAERMRCKIQSLAPTLSAQLYRPLVPADWGTNGPLPESNSDTQLAVEAEWTWDDAAQRLSRAYKEGGTSSWIEAAWQELEREVQMERKRHHHYVNGKRDEKSLK